MKGRNRFASFAWALLMSTSIAPIGARAQSECEYACNDQFIRLVLPNEGYLQVTAIDAPSGPDLLRFAVHEAETSFEWRAELPLKSGVTAAVLKEVVRKKVDRPVDLTGRPSNPLSILYTDKAGVDYLSLKTVLAQADSTTFRFNYQETVEGRWGKLLLLPWRRVDTNLLLREHQDRHRTYLDLPRQLTDLACASCEAWRANNNAMLETIPSFNDEKVRIREWRVGQEPFENLTQER